MAACFVHGVPLDVLHSDLHSDEYFIGMRDDVHFAGTKQTEWWDSGTYTPYVRSRTESESSPSPSLVSCPLGLGNPASRGRGKLTIVGGISIVSFELEILYLT